MLPVSRLVVNIKQPAGGIIVVVGVGPVGVRQIRPAGPAVIGIGGQRRAGGVLHVRQPVELVVFVGDIAGIRIGQARAVAGTLRN